MADFEHSRRERMTRQLAAERLVDLAYALTVGGTLAVDADGRRYRVRVPDSVELVRGHRSRGGRFELDVELTWSTAESQDPGEPLTP